MKFLEYIWFFRYYVFGKCLFAWLYHYYTLYLFERRLFLSKPSFSCAHFVKAKRFLSLNISFYEHHEYSHEIKFCFREEFHYYFSLSWIFHSASTFKNNAPLSILLIRARVSAINQWRHQSCSRQSSHTSGQQRLPIKEIFIYSYFWTSVRSLKTHTT